MGPIYHKVAIITGAGSGIGREIAILFAEAGAKVVLADIDEKSGRETYDLIYNARREVIFVKADAALAADHEKLVHAAVSAYGALHIAVNNAGIGGPIALTGEYPVDGWNKVIDINLNGVFYGMRYQLPAILESGGGAIVNMASILGAAGTRQSPAYVAAKHGVVGLTKAAALEYAAKGIRINAVGPGYIDTPLLKGMSDEARRQLESLHPMGRLGAPEEVAELVLWLCSSKASFVTGGYYPVDGGYLAQ
ncbi:SDR family NAD(P)-dependent oxidoreductase [Flavihumibacter petaseus]|uniref:Cyclohexanol dehydrogenase n=1 Tax=Flavihumibacter petaseus NBRC 106054 TaxID=1220578 RepID=A0A0E9MVX1_9BACT|nr:glucose 1-dehydrogenase [Flavihumibacter petaseus]GAO41648.1 cyclohexanol dehydrogenase [Flavihumibacter petaseus NBRC 106054]